MSVVVWSPIVERDISVHVRSKPPYSRMVSCSVDRHDGCPGGSRQCACSCHEGDWIGPETLPGLELDHQVRSRRDVGDA